MRFLCLFVFALLVSAAEPAADIRAVLDVQAAAWNRGDLDAFVQPYKNASDITFVGKAVSRGFDGILARYKSAYGSREKMGVLKFDEVEIRLLGKTHALVLGRFHLTRTAAGGGDASGRYTLVFEKTSQGWKIIHDHTS
jgi:uncharacterized protein (TIGR02246 family)